MTDLLFNLFGLFGVAFVLRAYYMNSRDTKYADSLEYYWFNILGSVLIIVSLFKNWNLPSCVIQVAWITISIGGIRRINRK